MTNPHIDILRNIEVRALVREFKCDPWLDKLSFSEAFLVCLGAGPWKVARREKIQDQALSWLDGRDLGTVTFEAIFPLHWQNRNLAICIDYLRRRDICFEDYCAQLIDQYTPQTRDLFYKSMGSPKGTKVLSLFCRDKLKIPAFPIDRHVKRYLNQAGLPLKEADLVALCRKGVLDTRKIATYMVYYFENTPTGMVNPCHKSRKEKLLS